MKPRIHFYHRQLSAVGYYRSWVPARYLARAGYDVQWSEERTFSGAWGRTSGEREKWAWGEIGKGPALVWVDRLLNREALGLFAGIRHRAEGCRMVVDFDDDFLHVPDWNVAQGKYQPGQEAREAGLWHLKLSELATVSTEPLAETFRERAHRVRVCHNAIDLEDWEGHPVDPEREHDPAVRVLYGGAMGHYGDTDVFRAAIERLLERPPVPWRLVVFGALPQWLHEVRERLPHRVVNLPFVPFQHYPKAVAWGGFDLAVAPLRHGHVFNEAKSAIKWLEASAQGIPFVCSKVGPYERDVPADGAIRVENTPEAWEEALQAALTDRGLREKLRVRAAEALRDEWTIDRRGQEWENAVDEALSAPRILSREDAVLAADRPAVGNGSPSAPGPTAA